jgi:hypothetical protein
MDGKTISIFGNSEHGTEPWEGALAHMLPAIALGEFFPGEMKVYVRYFDKFVVVQSLN